jgi:transmembrane sensor
MTGQGTQRRWSTNADEVQILAGAWIAKRDHSDWSAKDQNDLDAWLAESPAHMIAFLRLSDIWQRANRLRALGHQTGGGSALLRQQGFKTFVARFAAALAIVVLAVVGFARYLTVSQETTYMTPIGGHKIIALGDGSHIELNTDTVLDVRNSDRKQTVRLDKGEAYFQIKHNPTRNFVVLAGDHRIIDLGTKFLVRSEPNRLEVALVEGQVRFDARGRGVQSPILLTSGDVLVVSRNLITTSKKRSQALAGELGWRRGMLVFDNISLSQAVAEFNRYSSEKLVVADRAAAEVPVSATFPTNGVGDFVQLAQAVLGLRVEHRNGEIIISR